MISLEAFEAEQALKPVAKNHPHLNRVCARCGHRCGAHNSRGCTIGSTQHNVHFKRRDPKCNCRGYITPEALAKERAEEAAEQARRDAMPYECLDCQARFETVDDLYPLYECGNCGHVFLGEEGNRCTECNKFAAKEADHGCSECERGEVALREGFEPA